MARIRDRVFTDSELQQLVIEAYATAAYSLARCKQDHYERYERLGTALAQVLRERETAPPKAKRARASEGD